MPVNPLSPTSQTGTARPAQASKLTPLDPIRVLRQHTLILLFSVIVSLVVGVVGWFLLDRYSPRYTSEVQLTVSGGITNPYQGVQDAMGVNQTRLDLLEVFMQNQTIRLRSDGVLNDALKRDDVRRTRWFKSFTDRNDNVDIVLARKSLQRNLRAGQIIGSTLIRVSLTGPYPEDLKTILNTIVSVYLNKVRLETSSNSDNVRLMWVRERDRAEEELLQVQEQLRQFTAQNDLPNLESQNNEASITYRVLADQSANLEVALQHARNTYQRLLDAQSTGRVDRTPESLAMVEADPAISSREERLRSLREHREVLLARFGEKHRSIRDVDLQALATEQEKNRETDRLLRERQAVQLEMSKKSLDAYTSQLAGLQVKMDEARIQMRDLNDKLLKYSQIQVQAETATLQIAKAKEQLESIRIQSDRPDNARIRKSLDATDAEKTFPQPILVICGTMVLLCGCVTGVIFVKEVLDQRIKSPADIRLLPAAELIGVIPDAAEDPDNPASIERIVTTNPKGMIAESYRGLRTSLQNRMDRHGYKSLLVVGAQSQSGSSVVTSNLGLSLATNGRRALIIDANFRKPAQHNLLNTVKEPGLAEILNGTSQFEQVVVHLENPVLDVLPVGSTAGWEPELLDSPKFQELRAYVEQQYDIILIDVAPALLTSESTLLTKHVDAVVVVVRAMSDMRGMVGRLLRQIGGQRAELIGLILNGVRSSAGGYFRKNYQDFYRYRTNSETIGKPLQDRADSLEQLSKT